MTIVSDLNKPESDASCHEIIRGLHNLRPQHRGTVVTMGTFDGVHLGHQQILKQVTSKAAELGLASVAIIFEPQPHEFFAGVRAPARLMRFREKLLALFVAGIDRVLCLRFNHYFSSLSAREFVEKVLVEGLGVRHLIIGDDSRFGSGRSGDYEGLVQMGAEMGFEVVDTVTYLMDGERVSSTRIRAVLDRADFQEAARLLGRPYIISGHVQCGQQLGRQLGTPTANVHLRRYRSPLAGVFAVKVTLPDGQSWPGAANVGVRPTVEGGGKPLLEVHLINYSGDLYGKLIQVEFKKKVREEKRFNSLEELKAQIHADIQEVEEFFVTHPL